MLQNVKCTKLSLCYCQFSERKQSIDALSGSSEARFLVIMLPALENSLSDGVLVAGMHISRLAVPAIEGKMVWFFFHHSNNIVVNI